jgi:4-hydroxy-4-methyl-2-oxoglutarate aldolase
MGGKCSTDSTQNNVQQLNLELIEGFRVIDSATIYEAGGRKGALPMDIKPISRSMRVCGRALTVMAPGGDNLMVHAAVTVAQPGDVLVVQTNGYKDGAIWGDVLTTAAQARGVTGLVTDGCVRDSMQIVEMGFPVFCRGICVLGTDKKQPGTINKPINIGNVIIRAGDMIVADSDSVVVVSLEEAEAVLSASQARKKDEDEKTREIRAGATTVELFNLEPDLKRFGIL